MSPQLKIPGVAGKSCLLVDDIADMREIMVEWLRIYGFSEIREAENGELAWQAYCEKRPDLLITDIQMPVMSGTELIQRIRKDDEDLRIVVISGFIGEDYLPILESHGVAETVFKPFKPERMQEVLKRIFPAEKETQ